MQIYQCFSDQGCVTKQLAFAARRTCLGQANSESRMGSKFHGFPVQDIHSYLPERCDGMCKNSHSASPLEIWHNEMFAMQTRQNNKQWKVKISIRVLP